VRAEHVRIVPGLPPRVQAGPVGLRAYLSQENVDRWVRTAHLPIRLALTREGVLLTTGLRGIRMSETLAELELARLVVYSGPECRDRKDNDGDGKVDHPDDPQCGSSADNSEAPDPAPPGNTVLPAATGTPRDGQILTASNGTWSGSPTSFGYSWQRCDGAGAACVPIAGATARTYRASPADVGRRLRAVVTARSAVGAASATSAPTGIVAAAPPGNTAPPKIAGTAKRGVLLTASRGAWSGTAPLGFGYRWLRCNAQGVRCVAIPKATARTYRSAAGDVGRRLRIIVTARNAAGAAGARSAPTRAVAR